MMVGKTLAERYELLEKIAEGGMARVYRGRDLLLKRTIAIKILKDQMTGDAAFIRRFEREAQSAAALSHPHIVNIYDVGEEEGIHFMVMEYVDGKNLKEYIREKGKLAAPEAIKITRQIAEALEQAHQAGVIHRDIKPQNILFSRDGKVKVADFGIAIAGDGVTVTVGNTIIGSVQYISPEQARGEVAGAPSDLYSLGIVLYEMVTGKVPFTAESPVALAMKHIQEQIAPPKLEVETLPDALNEVIMKLVEKDAAQRYNTAAELLEDLFYAERSGTPRVAPKRRRTSFESDSEVILKPQVGKVSGEKSPGSSNFKKKWLKPVLLFILAAALLAGLGFVVSSYFFVPEIMVPDVRDLDQNEATMMLREAGLVPGPEIFYIHDDEIQVGNVVKTDPPAERTVRKDRVIDLFVSKGPEFLITPDLIERTEMEAKAILADLGLIMSPVKDYNDDVPEGVIYRQVPAESFPVSPGDEVVVYVSKGRGPFDLADLVGYSEEGAMMYLKDNELVPIVRYRFSVGSVGHVIEQEPQPGTEVLPGQFIELVIGE